MRHSHQAKFAEFAEFAESEKSVESAESAESADRLGFLAGNPHQSASESPLGPQEQAQQVQAQGAKQSEFLAPGTAGHQSE